MSSENHAESRKFVQLALGCEVLWTNHWPRADGTKSFAQARVDKLREAVEAGDEAAIAFLRISVLGRGLKASPWLWMVGRKRDSEQVAAVRRDVPQVDQTTYQLLDYVISCFGNDIDEPWFPRERLVHRDQDAMRKALSYMRDLLHANAKGWLVEKGIGVRRPTIPGTRADSRLA